MLPIRRPPNAIALPSAWAKPTELVGLSFQLTAPHSSSLYAQYTIGLHAWFLDQIRQSDPELSALLHDEQSEKAFTLSGLEGNLKPKGSGFQLQAGDLYTWTVTALSKPVVQWMARWLQQLPPTLELRDAPLTIQQVAIALPPTTYTQLWENARSQTAPVPLSFLSPTSFRRQGHHFPLPVPFNIYHSYLRRWNLFSTISADPDDYLAWIDESVLVLRHRIETCKVQAGKKGSVTGFTGAVEFGLIPKARQEDELTQLFYALSALAPYCGTGHKTTFGLGQTRAGWHQIQAPALPSKDIVITERIAELTEWFISRRRRTGGDRTTQIAETFATILARQELGESLKAIALDLEMPYDTVKSYAKRARKELQTEDPT